MIKHFRKCISVILVFTLLINTMVSTGFAQLVMPDQRGYKKDLADLMTTFQNQIKENLPSEKIKEICDGLSLCKALSGEGDSTKEVKVTLLYEDLDEIERVTRDSYGDSAEGRISEIVDIAYDELKVLNEYKTAAKELWEKNKAQMRGDELVKFLSIVVPSIYIADPYDNEFRKYFLQTYESYFAEELDKIKGWMSTNGKIDWLSFSKSSELEELLKDDNIKENAERSEVLGIGRVIMGYAMIGGYDKDYRGTISKNDKGKDSSFWIAANLGITELSALIVSDFTGMLMSAGRYDILKQYITILGNYETLNDGRHSKKDENFLLKALEGMDLFFVGTHIRNFCEGCRTHYAPGPVSQLGYYTGEKGEIRNIWEDLPSQIVEIGGEEGEQFINEIFFEEMHITSNGSNAYGFVTDVDWEKGYILPFQIGSIGTNKLKDSLAKGKVKLDKNTINLQKNYYKGTNVLGLAELALLNYSFYDVPDYNYYKRVRRILAGPYIGKILAEERGDKDYKSSRSNVNVYSQSTWRWAYGTDPYNPYVGALYHKVESGGQEGLLVNWNQNQWENRRVMVGDITKVAGIIDIATSLYYAGQIVNLVRNLVKLGLHNIKLMKIARAAKLRGAAGSVRSIMRGIRRDPRAYIIPMQDLRIKAGRQKADKLKAAYNKSKSGLAFDEWQASLKELGLMENELKALEANYNASELAKIRKELGNYRGEGVLSEGAVIYKDLIESQEAVERALARVRAKKSGNGAYVKYLKKWTAEESVLSSQLWALKEAKVRLNSKEMRAAKREYTYYVKQYNKAVAEHNAALKKYDKRFELYAKKYMKDGGNGIYYNFEGAQVPEMPKAPEFKAPVKNAQVLEYEKLLKDIREMESRLYIKRVEYRATNIEDLNTYHKYVLDLEAKYKISYERYIELTDKGTLTKEEALKYLEAKRDYELSLIEERLMTIKSNEGLVEKINTQLDAYVKELNAGNTDAKIGAEASDYFANLERYGQIKENYYIELNRINDMYVNMEAPDSWLMRLWKKLPEGKYESLWSKMHRGGIGEGKKTKRLIFPTIMNRVVTPYVFAWTMFMNTPVMPTAIPMNAGIVKNIEVVNEVGSIRNGGSVWTMKGLTPYQKLNYLKLDYLRKTPYQNFKFRESDAYYGIWGEKVKVPERPIIQFAKNVGNMWLDIKDMALYVKAGQVITSQQAPKAMPKLNITQANTPFQKIINPFIVQNGNRQQAINNRWKLAGMAAATFAGLTIENSFAPISNFADISNVLFATAPIMLAVNTNNPKGKTFDDLPQDVKDFVNLRVDFSEDIFEGEPLTEDEATHMKEILGEELFNLWQKYYNQDLTEYALQNPQDIAELIKYSNRYETTLPSRISKAFGGTNPLFVFAMRDVTNNLVQNVLSGQTMESVVENLSKDISAYHYKIAQIKLFQDSRKRNIEFEWSELSDENYLSQVSRSELYFGRFRTEGTAVSNYVNGEDYSEYLTDMLESPVRKKTYKGVELSTLSKYPDIKFTNIQHPRFSVQKDAFFKALQGNLDNIKPLLEKVQKGETLKSNEITKLNNNIAEISYIFANVMPFWRGSASANLAIVYGLYQAAGINAPQVKIGRALDLSAFATTPKGYKENWLNLFSDPSFTNIKSNIGPIIPISYFHTLTKNPWLKDREIIAESKPERIINSSRSISQLIAEAEEYGMPHEKAMEIGYGLPASEARRQLNDFILFNKIGYRSHTPNSTSVSQNSNTIRRLEKNFIRGKYTGSFKDNGPLSILLVTDDIDVAKKIESFAQKDVTFDIVINADDAIQVLQNEPNKYNFIFTDALLGETDGADVANYAARINIPAVLYTSIKTPSNTMLSYYDGFLNSIDNSGKEIVNYASNFYDIDESFLPDFMGNDFINFNSGFNTNVKKMSILVVNDNFSTYLDIKTGLDNFAYKNYIENLDFAISGEEVIDKLEENPSQYDIIFTDYLMDNGDGSSIANYVYENKLNIPVVLFSSIQLDSQELFNENHFAGSLNKSLNSYNKMFYYASNILAKKKPNVNKISSSSFYLRKYILPALCVGLLITSLFNNSELPLLTLASFPLFGGISGIGSRSDISNLSPNVQKFVALRKSFDKKLFRGNYLSVVEASNMKKIIGEDFYNRWMEYFEQNLPDYARENPQSIEELIKYSNRYEATLPSQINYRFTGTNPLYVYTMKDVTDNFEKDLLAGKTFKEAVMNIGKTMFLYHRKINQIRAFFEEQRESNNISWQYVRVPYGYHTVAHLNEKSAPSEFVGSKVKLKDSFIFGILEDAKPRIITPFDKESYGEYYWDLINVTNRPNVFKGVNLTYTKTRNDLMDMVYEDVMWHPLGVEDDGFNNVDAMFDAIQKDYDAIKPIIMRSRKGETLTENEVETLHNTISEISYLFTNAKPFYRGSASANLAIVYGLYEMAGINAPQVKMGKGLDLSAFITTPEQYRAIWKDLFADKFEIPNLAPKAPVKINKDEVSAQLLFSNWYIDKNLHILINKQGHMYKNLPSDFVKGNFFYRGMNLSSYKDLEDIFTKGLSVSKTKEQDGIYFSGNPEYAVMYAQDFKWGHVPVFLKMAQPSGTHTDIVESFSDLKAKDIDEVLVGAYMQGKLGWWKAGLNEQGEVMLLPTDNMENIENQNKGFFSSFFSGSSFNFASSLLGGIGVGLGLTMLLNGTFEPGLALASLPLLANTLPIINKKNSISAKTLFADKYIQSYMSLDDAEPTADYLPADFEEDGVLYRGMTLDNDGYESLVDILMNGLQGYKTQYGGDEIYFTDNVKTAIDYSAQYNYGYLPILIKSNADPEIRVRKHVFTFRDVEPENITDVLVWVYKRGKLGWWRASLDDNGEVILTPTYNTGKIENRNKGFSGRFDSSWNLLSGIGIGLGLTMLLNGVTAPGLALASIPFFASFRKPKNEAVEKFLDLRKDFDINIFKGPELSNEETDKLKAILGKYLFNSWYKYYNQDLAQFAAEHPEEINDIIAASNRYETTLPSLIYYRFKGTNPLFSNAMSRLSQTFQQNLSKNVPIKRAMVELGNEMFEYHKNMFRLQLFLEHKKTNTPINWEYIKNPPIYLENFEKNNNFDLAEDIGFGKLNNTFGGGFTITRGIYGEYLLEAVYAYNHPKSYKGIQLPFIDKIDKKGCHILYPNGTNPNGNNNDIAFVAMQSDLETITPIILKAKSGTKLSELELKVLHENIADMSYIFSNAVPFYRGTSAANLVMVYSLYEMAGIKAPQVRIGRQLDLTAVITTPEDYKKQWMIYLFEEPFTQTNTKPVDLKEGIKESHLVTLKGEKDANNPFIWELKDAYGNIDAYFKYATPYEIEKLKQLNRIVTRKKLDKKFDLISLEYPKILSTHLSSLPQNVVGGIKGDINFNAGGNIGTEPLIMSPISSGFSLRNMPKDLNLFNHQIVLEDLGSLRKVGLTALRNSPITNEEWEQVVGLFKSLNKEKFYYIDSDDIIFSRDASGKLNIGFKDFKHSNGPDLVSLKNTGFKLEDLGVKFKSKERLDFDTNYKFGIYHLFSPKNLFVSAITIGLGLTMLLNGTFEPGLALASIPFFASFRKPKVNINETINTDFKPVSHKVQYRTDNIFAETIFTDDYKNNGRALAVSKIAHAANLPGGFEESGAAYRGIALSDYQDLKTILTQGLLLNKTLIGDKIYFSSMVTYALDKATQADLGSIPVLIKMRSQVQGGSHVFVSFDKNIKAEDIAEVLVWANAGGKVGWHKAVLDEYDNVILQATDISEDANISENKSVSDNQSKTSAQVLFTDEYKKTDRSITWKQVKYLVNLLPEGFVEDNAIYRGMSFSKYDDLLTIFTEGVLNTKTVYHEGVYFSRNIKDAVEYATQFAFGHLPVMVKMYHQDPNAKKYIPFADGVKAEDVAEVLVWAEVNGKLGWHKVSLDKGEVVLSPTDKMTTTDNFTQMINSSDINIIKYIIPGLSIGLALTMLLTDNPVSAFTLAAMPLISNNLWKNQKPVLDLKKDITSVTFMPDWKFTAQLRGAGNRVKAYYKRVQPDESHRTQVFGMVMEELDVPNNYTIGVEYPKVISTKGSDLPDGIRRTINNYFDEELKGTDYTKEMIVTAVNTSGYVLYKEDFEALKALNGQPITNAEWAEIIRLVDNMHKAGFHHTDLRYNLFFRRDSKGKLIITFIDFEYSEHGNDMGDLEIIRERLESVGAKEKADEGISVQPKLTPKLSNYLIPTIMGGLGLTMLLNGVTTPGFALAVLPFLASFKKPSIFSQYKITQNFLGLRKRFQKQLFQGPELSAEETDKMKEILGKDFFNLWQKYYRADLTDIVTKHTDEAAEYVHFSNRYENTLISLISNKFDNASNPLFVEHMKGLSASFAQDLLEGKTIKEAFTQIGQQMFEYHKKINQVASFIDYKKKDKKINWSTVKSPSGYGLLSGKHNHDVGFGILRRAEPSTWSVAIRPTSYGEYLERAKTQYSHPENYKYKGVRLTYFDEYNEKDNAVELSYPSVYDRNGVSNIESLFNALQDDWEQIKPIILKVQAGGDLTGSEIKYLHENISDMSYLWANAVPFYRGSASGNLVMVYALYSAAGIIAPKVKLGKALDLEAFITTPQEYKENWLNLFDGKFEVVTPEKPVVPSQQKEIPAQVLFSGEHKTDLSISQEDSKEIMKYLPSGFLEDNTIYRGMRFSVNSYEDLETVLKVGLLTNKTQGVETIFFSPSVEMAIDYAKRVKEGEIPILVKMPYKQPNSRREEYNSLIDNSGIRTAPPSNEVFFSDDIEADKLTGTLVWAELDGKKGWWKAVVNEKGEIILQATDNMQTVTAPAVKPETTPKLSNYLMPAIGVGLGLTMLLNGAAEPGLAVAALPFFASFKNLFTAWQRNKKINKFIKLRKSFDVNLFTGPEIFTHEAKKMKEILGKDFYNKWLTYYNQDLPKYARQHPQEIDEIIDNSNRYETTLPSLMKYRFRGVNPLYTNIMKETSEAFKKDIFDGKTIQEAITHVGNLRQEYHRKIAQIEYYMFEKIAGPVFMWGNIQNPNIPIGFGELNKDVEGKGAIISPNTYSEYFKIFSKRYKHNKNYKGVNLTILDGKTPNSFSLAYPNGINDDGINNNTAAFRELQKDYEQIKPLISKYQNGIKLTKKEINLLHNTIADMSYIFTNAVPFFRGTSSINLTMVYSLYEMAGINAPQVKIGKALDLEAFATTPEDYKTNWQNLFDGDFEIIAAPKVKTESTPKLSNYLMPAIIGGLGLTLMLNGMPLPALTLASLPLLASTRPIISQTNGISAKVLFTDEYKNKDIITPPEDEQNYGEYWVSSNVDIARGMAIGTYEGLKGIFKGLSGKQVRDRRADGKIYFSNIINIAVHYAKKDEYGHIPVVVISNKEVPNRDKGGYYWSFDNFAKEDIKEVLVWADIDGKRGWWRAQPDNNGEVILKYTGKETLKGYGTFTVSGGGII